MRGWCGLWVCKFKCLWECLSQILSNCRLNLARNSLVCSLNLANFKFLSEFNYLFCTRKSALHKNFLWVLNFVFYMLAWVFEAKFGKRNIVLIILFMLWLNLMRNLLIYGLNAVNFNFRLPKFIPHFLLPLTWVLCWNLTR